LRIALNEAADPGAAAGTERPLMGWTGCFPS